MTADTALLRRSLADREPASSMEHDDHAMLTHKAGLRRAWRDGATESAVDHVQKQKLESISVPPPSPVVMGSLTKKVSEYSLPSTPSTVDCSMSTSSSSMLAPMAHSPFPSSPTSSLPTATESSNSSSTEMPAHAPTIRRPRLDAQYAQRMGLPNDGLANVVDDTAFMADILDVNDAKPRRTSIFRQKSTSFGKRTNIGVMSNEQVPTTALCAR